MMYGRLLAELYTDIHHKYFTGMQPWALGDALWSLPPWGWKYTATDYAEAHDDWHWFAPNITRVSVWEDLRYLQQEGNKAAHLRYEEQAMENDENTMMNKEELTNAFFRIMISCTIWIQKMDGMPPASRL
jgi:hypothetical protein